MTPLEQQALRLERNHGRPWNRRTPNSELELQAKAKSFGFWGLSTPQENGGMALAALLQSLITTEVGRSAVLFTFGGEADNILFRAQRLPAAGVPATDHRRRSDLLLRHHRTGRRTRRGEYCANGPPGRRGLDPERRKEFHHQGK